MAQRKVSRICQACGRGLALSDLLNWYHVDTGLVGWVDDPTGRDAAHKSVPFSAAERESAERSLMKPMSERI